MIKQFFNKLPRKPAKLGESSDLDSELDAESLPGLNSTSNSWLNHASRIPQALNLKLNGNSTISVYEALPSFRDVATSEKQALFLKKLNLCCVVFDFNDSKCHLKEKDIKQRTLLELIDFFASAKEKFTETIMQEIVKMVSINLFESRTPPPRENKVLEDNDLEEELSLMDPSWPHMELVYELLLRFLASPETDAKLAKQCIDHPFILRLLDFFDSKDPREREYLKTILHRLYGKFMVHRPFIRVAIGNVFDHFIFETKKHNGIGELLAVLGSIINGFILPLKEQHKLFLFQYLIPLHKLKCLSLYHEELSYCIAQYVEKDCKLVDAVVMGLLEYWPIANSSMEVLFLVELEKVWEVTQEFQSCVVPLFCQIATCISSSDFEVAETALLLWNDDHVVNLLQKNRKDIFPIILPVLEKKARESLDPRIESLTLGLQKLFSDMDAELFDECFVKFAGR